MKPRSDSRLFKLSADQQAQLYDWIHKLGYAKAKELAAQPPPQGFGVKTHLNSLCRFVARYTEIQQEQQFFDILHCASGHLHPQALRAAETMAHQMAFDIARLAPSGGITKEERLKGKLGATAYLSAAAWIQLMASLLFSSRATVPSVAFSPAFHYPAGFSPCSIVGTDVNGDENLDLVVA
jgi:hypothetical protein